MRDTSNDKLAVPDSNVLTVLLTLPNSILDERHQWRDEAQKVKGQERRGAEAPQETQEILVARQGKVSFFFVLISSQEQLQ